MSENLAALCILGWIGVTAFVGYCVTAGATDAQSYQGIGSKGDTRWAIFVQWTPFYRIAYWFAGRPSA